MEQRIHQLRIFASEQLFEGKSLAAPPTRTGRWGGAQVMNQRCVAQTMREDGWELAGELFEVEQEQGTRGRGISQKQEQHPLRRVQVGRKQGAGHLGPRASVGCRQMFRFKGETTFSPWPREQWTPQSLGRKGEMWGGTQRSIPDQNGTVVAQQGLDQARPLAEPSQKGG